MRREIERTEDGVGVGLNLTSQEADYLQRSIPPSAIFENLDRLNEEIAESHGEFIEGSQVTSLPKAETAKSPEKVKRSLSPKQIVNKPITRTTPIAKREEMPAKTFEQELAEIEANIPRTQETPKIELSQAEQDALSMQRVYDAIKKMGGPSQQQIASWRREFGGVYILPFKEDDIYIHKHLTRAMWQNVQGLFDKMKDSKSDRSEDELKELVVRHCLLWPTPTVEFKVNSKAGLIPSLFDSIWMKSYFLSNQAIAAITIEL